MTFWTEERVTELRGHFDAGLSATEIACEIGGLTRNAVLGKLHRLGLTNQRPRIRQRARPNREGVRKPFRSPALECPPQPARAPATAAVAPKAIWKPCTIFDLTNDRCRWSCACAPADPSFHFCGGTGADLAAGKPYCDAHSRMAYRRPGEGAA